MKRSGVFYHKVCGEKAYFSLAMSVREGFDILQQENLLTEPNILLFESEPVTEELILKVHARTMLESVKRSGYYETALYSTGSVVQATEKVLTKEIDNALAFVGVGGHHAGRTDYWGGCFLNPMAIAIENARQRFGTRRFAIVDTDTHHGDGTREIFREDEDVLHICFCEREHSDSETKVCLSQASNDEDSISKLVREVPLRISDFKPELIYWLCGLDTHKDSYGTRRLTESCYPKLGAIIKDMADNSCDGKLIVKIGCNAPAHVSEYVAPRILSLLGELNRYQGD